jgi:hypothetical protein
MPFNPRGMVEKKSTDETDGLMIPKERRYDGKMLFTFALPND